jgi:AraC-like DNA-binding protein
MSFAHLGKPERIRRDSALAEGLNAEELNKKIEIMMDEDELFCDEELSLGRFSHALEISSHQLSAFLNDHYGKNFNAFINAYRIRFACDQIVSDPAMSILSIAFASGFNSYSAFFTAFKKETGLSPREYKNSRSRPPLKKQTF